MTYLYFYYSAMNAGKSTSLLQSSYNYQEMGMKTLILTSKIDTRFSKGKITSRIGLTEKAILFSKKTNIKKIIKHNKKKKIHCILIDECQFLTKKQVKQICIIVDKYKIPTLCYGLRTDFKGNLFEGSKYLLAWADKLIELRTICFCGKKANRVLKINEMGKIVSQGEQIEIGGNEKYISVCRKHYMHATNKKNKYIKKIEKLESIILKKITKNKQFKLFKPN